MVSMIYHSQRSTTIKAAMVIILFNTGLYKCTYSNDSFSKLVFCLSALFTLC